MQHPCNASSTGVTGFFSLCLLSVQSTLLSFPAPLSSGGEYSSDEYQPEGCGKADQTAAGGFNVSMCIQTQLGDREPFAGMETRPTFEGGSGFYTDVM